MNALRQVCTFIVDSHLIGLDTKHVREVLRFQELTNVPLSPLTVSGLINLRGEIVTALDLRIRLELPPRASDQPPINVVVRNNSETVSLLVDEIGDVLEVTEDTFEPAPEHLEGAAHDLIVGTYQLEDKLLLMLNLKNTMDLSDSTTSTRSVHASRVAKTDLRQTQ